MGKHRYRRPGRLPVLAGDAFLRRRLTLDPHCHWCRRRVYNPRNRAQAPAGQVAVVDYKNPDGDIDNDRNCLVVCTECKEARVKMDRAAFGKRIQGLRAGGYVVRQEKADEREGK